VQEQKTRAAKGRAARQEAVEFNVPSFGSRGGGRGGRGGRGGNRGGEPRQEKKVIIMFKIKNFIILIWHKIAKKTIFFCFFQF
jgi:hypothetical protein